MRNIDLFMEHPDWLVGIILEDDYYNPCYMCAYNIGYSHRLCTNNDDLTCHDGVMKWLMSEKKSENDYDAFTNGQRFCFCISESENR